MLIVNDETKKMYEREVCKVKILMPWILFRKYFVFIESKNISWQP